MLSKLSFVCRWSVYSLRRFTTEDKEILRALAMGTVKEIGPREQNCLLNVLIKEEMSVEVKKREQAEQALEQKHIETTMVDLLREKYGFSARGVIEHWNNTVVAKYPGTKPEQWQALFSDRQGPGPALLRCLEDGNPHIRGAKSAATHVQGLFSSMSGIHHHKWMDIEDNGSSIIIASCLSGPNRRMLACLCTCAQPAPLKFRIVDVTEEGRKLAVPSATQNCRADMEMHASGAIVEATMHVAPSLAPSDSPALSDSQEVEDREIKHSFLVPKKIVGKIIGRQGATIKRIQHESGARAMVDQQVSDGMPCKVNITGNPQTVAACAQIIQEIMKGSLVDPEK
eukprot:gene7898-9416_t